MLNGHTFLLDKHAAELRRCLVDLDIEGMRRLHHHLWPGTPQPKTDEEALISMHAARVKMKSIHPRLRAYSEAWLFERHGPVACAVGVAVKVVNDEGRARNVRDAMLESVADSIKAGIDIDKEAPEVRRRMAIARKRA